MAFTFFGQAYNTEREIFQQLSERRRKNGSDSTVNRTDHFSEEEKWPHRGQAAYPSAKKLATVVGKMASVHRGENLMPEGDWEHHPTYGKEFQVKDFESIWPTTIEQFRNISVQDSLKE